MEGYRIGDTPPGLADDGSFDVPIGPRVFAIVDEEGRILVVDKKTKKLVEDTEHEADE